MTEVPYPHRFICSITHAPFKKPVITQDGNVYECHAIEEWLGKHDTSPLTNVRLPSKALAPGAAILDNMREWRKDTGISETKDILAALFPVFDEKKAQALKWCPGDMECNTVAKGTIFHQLVTNYGSESKEHRGIGDAIAWLILNKADVNKRWHTVTGRSPLDLAVNENNLAVVTHLLEYGADANSSHDGHGSTALKHCTSGAMAKLLLDAKADPMCRDHPPVTYIARYGHVDVLREILQRNGYAASNSQASLVRVAVSAGRLDTLKLLVEFKADPNTEPTYGQPLLHHAMATVPTNLSIIKYLVENKANISEENDKGLTPLLAFPDSNIGDLDAVKYLIEQGADVEASDKHGATRLHTFAKRVNVEGVRVMLEAGANPMPTTNLGSTPLDYMKNEDADGGCMLVIMELLWRYARNRERKQQELLRYALRRIEALEKKLDRFPDEVSAAVVAAVVKEEKDSSRKRKLPEAKD